MRIRLDKKGMENAEILRLERATGEVLKRCYQCGNCSGGCPVSYAMDIPPHKVMRYLQMGMLDEVERANTMWLCVGCLQCYSRCPQGCSVASVLEGLRQASLRSKGDHEKVKEIPIPFLKNAPQQAIVCGFRKFVS